MKHLCLIGSAVALALASGCASSKQSRTEAPDGLYFRTDGTGPSYPMTMLPPNGGPPAKLDIQEYRGFVPQRVLVVNRPEAFFVELIGQGVPKWSDQGIFLIADQVPYWQLRKTPQKPPAAGQKEGSPATIVLIVGSRKEADKVAAAMRKRYSLPPEPEPPPAAK